jgi:hypothetical protein
MGKVLWQHAQNPPPRGQRVGWSFTLTFAAYNLVRLPKLLVAA